MSETSPPRDAGAGHPAPATPSDGTRPPHVIIRASAGTGKTFQLSNRYLQLVLMGHAPERILATTFTRKAAGEILERILQRLATAAEGPDKTRQLALQLGQTSLTVDDCRRALQRLTRNLHRVRVSTLDSFFLQATQSLSLELGLPPSWQILDEAEELQLREQAIAAMLACDDHGTVMQLLHWLAKGATHRGVSQLLSDTVVNMYSLYLESPAAAWQRLPRLPGCTADELQQLQAALQAWLDEAAGDKRLRKAVASLAELVRDEAWEALAKGGISAKLMGGERTYYGKELPPDLVRIIQPVVDHVRAVVQNRIALQTEASYALLHRFHGEFESLKLDRRVLRFSDLARHLGRLEKTAHLSQLSFRLDASIDGLLLDEFQDTSLDQWRVIRPFARHATADDPQCSFLCVGDLKQAIYGWRGGNAELMDAVAAELGGLTTESLDRSFRSAPVVIDVVNQINSRMDQHDNLDQCQAAVKAWVKRFPAHTTRCDQLAGYVSLETTDWAASADEQRTLAIRLAADRVQALRAQSPQLKIAVLVRTNDLVGRVMFELQRRGMLASEEGGNPLTNSAAVQLILSLLTLADHPQDSAARFHLANSSWGSALGLRNHLDDAAAQSLSQDVRFALADLGYGQVVNAWSAQLQPWTNARERRRLNQLVEMAYRYQQLVESPRDVGCHRQHVKPISTAEFVARVTLQRVSDPTEDPVRVMNVHQSKGLQFDVVILPDLDRKLEPHRPTYAVDRVSATEPIRTVVRWVPKEVRELMPPHIQRVHQRDQALRVREELSVLYVALTRAVHSLQMIIAPSQQVSGADASAKSLRDPEGKKLPRTVAGLIRAALTDHPSLEPNQIVFELGDRDWWQTLRNRPALTVAERVESTPQVVLRPSDEGTHKRGAAAVRPSMLEGGGHVRLLDRLSLPGQLAMQRGSLIHAFFEQIEWIENGPPDVAALRAIGLSMDADPEHLHTAIELFQQMLARPSLREVLARERYQGWFAATPAHDRSRLQLEARREQRLIAQDGDDWLSGSIDRLVLLRRQAQPVAAEIMDFKTDAIPSTAVLDERVDHYRPQLLAYRRGVSQMLRLDRQHIATSLLFVQTGQLVSLTSAD